MNKKSTKQSKPVKKVAPKQKATAQKTNSKKVIAKLSPLPKAKVGFYSITGCAGCLLSVIFNETEILDVIDVVDIESFPFIKGKNSSKDEMLDLVFMEGLVAKEEDITHLKEVREKAKFLVALGACADTGGIPAMRNFISKNTFHNLVFPKIKKLSDVDPTPIDAHVHVDYALPGCPPDKKQILNFIKCFVAGKVPVQYNDPVCKECKFNNNQCLLKHGKICLGPITRGGCNSVCINNNLECWGCRGPTPNANVDGLIAGLKGDHDINHIKDRLKAFAGLKVPKIKEEAHYESQR